MKKCEKQKELLEKYYNQFNKPALAKLVEEAKTNKIGTLFVASTFESYLQFIEQFDIKLNHNYFYFLIFFMQLKIICSYPLISSSTESFAGIL